MADCPKCGRQLTVAGSCIKCGQIADRSKWYAIAEENAREEKKQPARAANAPSKKPKAHVSEKRADWYKAAGMEVPDEPPPSREEEKKPVYVDYKIADEHFVEVSKGRRDPPFKLIGGIAGFLVVVAGLIWYAGHGAEAPPEPVAELPMKNIQVDKSYGFKVDPPDGFKQQQVQEPDFLKGVHGELTHMVSFRDPQSGIEGYYFGEVKKGSNLDTYASVSVSDLGKLTPLPSVPDGMKAYPTKGYLIDMGPRKALAFVGAAKPDRYLTVFVVAPSATFDSMKAKVESAASAFSIIEPTGPHPGMTFAPSDTEE